MKSYLSSKIALGLALRLSALVLFVLGGAVPARAAPLRVVEVGAPAINCKFDADCKVSVKDFADPFVLAGSSGEGRLQSRLWPRGEAGTVGAGLYAYLYRVDLRNLTGLTALACVRALRIEFGPVASLDYDDDGFLDDVFVVTQGGLGSVAPSSAERIGNAVTFYFNPAVCAGSAPGGGESTFFFGLASEHAPGPVSAQVSDTLGGLTNLEARGPQLPLESPRFLRGDANVSGVVDVADAVFVLQYLFLGGEPSSCEAAADVNDSGAIELTDAISLLGHLFLGGPQPAAPFPVCGVDLRPGPLGCERYPVCPQQRCPDPKAESIEFEIASLASRFAGEVQIVGRAVNVGGHFDSSPGQQALYLYEMIPGGSPALVAREEFVDLAPGADVVVTYTRRWNASSPAEGEFPPSYRLVVLYDPDIYIDGNEGNDDCFPDNNATERSGWDINALFE